MLVAGAAEMGLPGIFGTQDIRSSHVKGASICQHAGGYSLISVLNETSHNSKNKETFQIEGLIQLKRISNSLKRCQNYLRFSHSKLSFASQADGSPSPERRSQKHGTLEWTKCALNQYFYM